MQDIFENRWYTVFQVFISTAISKISGLYSILYTQTIGVILFTAKETVQN